MKMIMISLPEQDSPSPEYPGLHIQLYDPLVLLHTASTLQLCCPLAHSSTSEKGALYASHIMLFYIEPILLGNCNPSLSYLGGARNGTSPRRLQSVATLPTELNFKFPPPPQLPAKYHVYFDFPLGGFSCSTFAEDNIKYL